MTMDYPDIEIYVKRPAPERISEWLDARFGIASASARGEAMVFRLGADQIECVVVENAVKGGYASIWFRSDSTPWQSDQDCARDAFDFFDAEVRCSAAPWEGQDAEADTGGWIRFTDKGESRVNWRA